MMSQIRAVFLGSPQFAVPSLNALIQADDIHIPLIVTQPDRPAGRGRKLQPPAVRVAADASGIDVLQPETLRDDEVIEQLRHANPDLIVVVSYGEILQNDILQLPPFGCLNVHPSLLPAYRGSLPIQAPILNGDAETGVTVIKLVRKMDAGPIVARQSHTLRGDETAGLLSEELSDLAAKMLPGVIKQWADGDLTEQEQDESLVTYTRELRKADAAIDWSWSSQYIERFVRAMSPWPRAWTTLDGQRLSVLSAGTALATGIETTQQGAIVEREGRVYVVASSGLVELLDVQPAGKKSMPASAWFRGLRDRDSLIFESPATPVDPIIFRK